MLRAEVGKYTDVEGAASNPLQCQRMRADLEHCCSDSSVDHLGQHFLDGRRFRRSMIERVGTCVLANSNAGGLSQPTEWPAALRIEPMI